MSAATSVVRSPDAAQTNPAMERYRGDYKATDAILAWAENIRYGSISGAGLLVIATLLVYQSIRTERSGFPIVSVSLVAGNVALVFGAYLCSAILRRLAKQRRAALDLDVISSPLLSEGERTQILQFPNARLWKEINRHAA